MIRKTGARETVLYYSPEKKPYETKLKGLFVRMGIRVRTAAAVQAGERVGVLMGLLKDGGSEAGAKEGAAAEPEGEAGAALKPAGAAPEEETAGKPEPAMTQELLVLHNFSSSRLDLLLAGMRKAGIPRIALKAVVTETNRYWTLEHLYREIEEEHRRMTETPEGGEAHV